MLLAALAAVTLTAATPPPKPFIAGPSVEGVSEYSLPNGLKVLFIPDAAKPTVLVNMVVLVGSRNENYGEKGMAHLFEHMLFKKTKKFPDVKAELTRLGGIVNGSTWFDRTNYFESFPYSDEKLKTAIELEAERLRNAIVSREQLVTEMTVVRNEFESGENSPEAVLEERVYAAAFQWHNYGNTTIGAKSDIERVPNERLLAFYDMYYQPDNAVLVIAGKFDEAKTFKFIADTFGKMPKPKRSLASIKTYTEEPTHDGETSVLVRRVGGTPVFIAGYHVPGSSDPDAAAIDVLENVLGASPSGRLYKDLVETKKAASVGCSTMPPSLEVGYFTCSAQLNAKDGTAPVRDGLLSAMENIGKRPFSREDVERAKSTLLKGYEMMLNNGDRLGQRLTEYIGAGDWRLVFFQRDRIEGVTVEDVNRVAAKYFKSSNRTLGEYVPTEKPDRAEVAPVPELATLLKGYTGRETISAGEAFDTAPKNVDARTTRTALSDGMKLAFLPKKTRGETVRVLLNVRFGTDTSLKNQRVISDMTARMLNRGTKTRTRQQIKDRLDALKAQVSFTPGPQFVSARIEVRKPQLKETLEIVADMLKNPAFDPKEFEQLKREVVAGLEEQKDDPQALGTIALQRTLSPFQSKGHPLYVMSIGETLNDTNAVTLEQLKTFHSKFYGSQFGYGAVVGDFDAKELQAQLESQYGTWKAAEQYARIPVPFTEIAAKSANIDTPDKKMAFFGSGTSIQMKDSDPDFPALAIADYMLGGGFLSGRVPQRLREKEGWSYGAGTQLRAGNHDDFSALIGYAIYAPQNAEKLEKGFFEEINRAVEKGFTDDELKLAREGFLRRQEQVRSDDNALATQLVMQLDLGRTTAFDQQIEDRVRALSLSDVNAALKKYVDAKKFSVVKAGDFKQVAAPK